MSDYTYAPGTCIEWTTSLGWDSRPCGKTGVVERDGKFYCGIHNPEKAEKRDAARRVKWEAEEATKKAKQDAQKLLTLKAAFFDDIVAAMDAAGVSYESNDLVIAAFGARVFSLVNTFKGMKP